MMLSAKGIKKSYDTLQILKGIDLEIAEAEVISIVGSSGAGKTTLLQILGTLDTPDAGNILIAGTDPFSLSSKKLAAFRNESIGFIFQFHQLLPEFTALENVCMPGWIAKQPKKKINDRAIELLDFMGLADKATKKPNSLSGGEQQRVAVARALLNSPELIFADEPTGNLDSENAAALHELFIRLRNEMNQSFLIVTHNEQLASMSNRTLHMKDGKFI